MDVDPLAFSNMFTPGLQKPFQTNQSPYLMNTEANNHGSLRGTSPLELQWLNNYRLATKSEWPGQVVDKPLNNRLPIPRLLPNLIQDSLFAYSIDINAQSPTKTSPRLIFSPSICRSSTATPNAEIGASRHRTYCNHHRYTYSYTATRTKFSIFIRQYRSTIIWLVRKETSP